VRYETPVYSDFGFAKLFGFGSGVIEESVSVADDGGALGSVASLSWTSGTTASHSIWFVYLYNIL
jgi:hypothetical protein